MVYLIHFNRKFKHAGHYLGFCETDQSIDKRLTDHLCGLGARLMSVVTDAGIEWKCVRLWFGADRTFERRLKQKGKARICPICSPKSALRRANDYPNGPLKGVR